MLRFTELVIRKFEAVGLRNKISDRTLNNVIVAIAKWKRRAVILSLKDKSFL